MHAPDARHIDQRLDRPGRTGLIDQIRQVGRVGDIGGDRDGPSTRPADFGHQGVCSAAGGRHHGPTRTRTREPRRHRPPDAR